jgi:hypothetical protein
MDGEGCGNNNFHRRSLCERVCRGGHRLRVGEYFGEVIALEDVLEQRN